MNSLPFEIVEAMIQCFGRSFHFKDKVTSFMISCGVPRTLANKYRDLPKFVWARNVLTDLEQVENGMLIQRRILTELCKLKNVPDDNVPDRNSALDALKRLKQLAASHDMVVQEEKKTANNKRELAEQKQQVIKERNEKLEAVRQKFNDGISTANRQKAGYILEDILYELFSIFEIEYRKPYKTPTQQIDGHFILDGFDYLVEAKWRKDYPNAQDIAAFKNKVDTKLESTRGFFISILGFRDEVMSEFSGRGAKIVFMSGMELSNILEGRASLVDVLREKIKKAAQEGIAFYTVMN